MSAGDRWELSAAERRAWRDDGFFVRREVFPGPEVEALRAAAERVRGAATRLAGTGRAYAVDGNRYVDTGAVTIQFEHRPGSPALRVVEPFHHLDPLFDALIDDVRLVAPMRGLTGSEHVALWTDKLNFKPPREGSGFRWHQDSPYWAHACTHLDRLPNVMLALDDSDAENGCLRVVRGSHQRGMLPGLQDASVLGPLFTDPRGFAELEPVAAAMPAGSLLFFSPHSVHGSEPNRSERMRRALVLTYQPSGFDQFKVARERTAGARPGADAAAGDRARDGRTGDDEHA